MAVFRLQFQQAKGRANDRLLPSLGQEPNQSGDCDQFSSQAEQTRQYLERVRSTQTANMRAVDE